MIQIEKCKLVRICATTNVVNCGDVRIGTINYPGTGLQADKSLKHHATLKDENEPSGSRDLGHFADVYQAFDAIEKAHTCKVMTPHIAHRIIQRSKE